MIVVDTSVVVAIFAQEPETAGLLDALAGSDECLISAGSVLEASIVIRLRKALPHEQSEAWLDEFLATMRISIEPIGEDDLRLARQAHLKFGKGTGHPAQLNFGDCFPYALAKRLSVPLLYKGDDFAKTDVKSAL